MERWLARMMAGSLLVLCACAQAPGQATLISMPARPQSPTFEVTVEAAPSLASTPAPGPSVTPTHTPIPLEITLTSTPTTERAVQPELCSPLADIPISELNSIDLLKNGFDLPRPGMDDGHHGADFAYWSRGDRKSMLDHPVLSVMEGRVAGLVHDRTPYGYAVIIETPLDPAWQPWLEAVSLPEPAPTVLPASSLYCPTGADFLASRTQGTNQRSLYHLYAHLNRLPELSVGQTVKCGQQIGEVGTTGNSVNLHLHLETRVGPSGIVIPEMAHYENDATDAEMHAYCTWRVSGLFQMFDPLQLFLLPTLQP